MGAGSGSAFAIFVVLSIVEVDCLLEALQGKYD